MGKIMKKYVIKNKDGSQQHVMPAVHDTRKKAEETLIGYVHNLNKFSKNYLSLFDFIIEKECIEPNELVPDFEHAKQIIDPSSGFILAKESLRFSDVELNTGHIGALIALNELFTIAQAWNKLDDFVPDFSNEKQIKWIPMFSYCTGASKFACTFTTEMSVTLNKNVCPQLCFKTQERAWQFGSQFIDLYNQVFL